MQNGTISVKTSVIDFNTNFVYTKKVAIPCNNIVINDCVVKFISITSNSKKFDDVTAHDIRVNFKNPIGMWVNVYAESLSDCQIEKIIKCLIIK